MTPYVEQSRTTQQQQEQQQRQDRGFEHLGAPALSTGLEIATFGPGPAAVKALFKIAPMVFEGMTIPDGTNFPSIRNRLVDALLAEQEALLRAA